MYAILITLSFLTIFSNPLEATFHHETLVTPYLIPEEHPYSVPLEKIFSKTNAPLTIETINALGFKILKSLGLHVVVAKHPCFPGCVFKFHKYESSTGLDFEQWIERIKGAKVIKDGIEKFGYKKFFKVPKKWIIKTNATQTIDGVKYPCYVLMAEDVKPLSRKSNHALWRQVTTEKQLDALHNMLKTYGLRDCARVDNVPRCKNGKIAFLDTETTYKWPVNYHPLMEFLSKKNKKYWKATVTKDGTKFSAY